MNSIKDRVFPFRSKQRKTMEKSLWVLGFFFPSFLFSLSLTLGLAGSQMIVGSNWKLSPLLLKSFHKTLSYFIKSLNEFSRY